MGLLYITFLPNEDWTQDLLLDKMTSIRPKKSLGQHFLKDARIARRIVEALDPREGDVVLEIGPGEVALTRHLVETPAHLVLVDVDERVIARMKSEFGTRAKVVHADILKVMPETVAREERCESFRVIGNIPYYITSPILFHFLDHRSVVRDLCFMMQREVAQRIVAQPRSKEYGVVSVFCQWMTKPELLFDVHPGSFSPPPDVESSVVRLSILDRPVGEQVDERWFRTVVRTVFNQRRKTLRNSLRSIAEGSLDRLDAGLLSKRPEELGVLQFVELAKAIQSSRNIVGTVEDANGNPEGPREV